jgi:tRNA threonylcarbamoyladenosine biosynthesis protein TsaE
MPILDSRTMEFFSRSPEQTRRVGMKLGSLLQPGDLICLSGDLGAGKTTLMQGIAQGFGSLDPVSSPTFVLVNQYRRNDGLCIHHMDAYRMGSPEEAEDLDLDLMLESGVLVVEWAERIRAVLPGECFWIKMRYIADEQRGMVITAHGKRMEAMLEQFRKKVFGGK